MNRWSGKLGYKVAVTVTALVGLSIGVIAIFVWPAGFAVPPVLRFVVGCLVGSIVILLLSPVVAVIQFRKEGNLGKKSPPGDRFDS